MLILISPISVGLLIFFYFSKYELSKTFGLVTSSSSNIAWAPGENAGNPTFRFSGVGKAVVGADEDVFCWDIKKGELLGRWKDNNCKAEVTAIKQSSVDSEVYAVG